MYQTITSGLMAASAGESAEGVKELCSRRMQVQVWERKPFATPGYNQRFIYSVFTKVTFDEKGQARDTSTLVTFNAPNSTKNSQNLVRGRCSLDVRR